ncbi:hypothetical protein ACOMHN_002577 [Nucella lapillus]
MGLPTTPVCAVAGLLCMLVLLAPSIVRAQGDIALTYDEQKVRVFGEFTQYLRDGAKRMDDEYTSRIDTINSMTQSIASEITQDKDSASQLISSVTDTLSDIYLSMNKIMTPMMLAHCKGYITTDDHIYSVTMLDHGMGYDSDAGEVTITKGGVYFFEYKGQSNDNTAFATKTVFSGPSSYTISSYIDWEISPFYEVLYLQAGTKVSFKTLREATMWGANPSGVTTGIATQASLRYLGKYN